MSLTAKEVSNFQRTRIAPTPSGFLHLGNIFSFALTSALAARTGANILLRIDDLDRARVRKTYVQDIFDTLNFLQLHWNEGPAEMASHENEFSQLHRLPLYQKALEQLTGTGQVFACTCSRSQWQESGAYPGTCRNKDLPLDTPGASLRLRTDERPLQVRTIFDETITKELPAEMKDFVVRKKDGYPAYQLTSLVDDIFFDVDLIVRGADLWPSTLAQHYLAQLLDARAFLSAGFCHHPLLTEKDGSKLSKSEGATSVRFLRNEGKTAEAIFALIGQMSGCATATASWCALADAFLRSIFFN